MDLSKLFLAIILASTGIGLGVLIGYHASQVPSSTMPGNQQNIEEDESISTKLIAEMKSDNIRNHLK